MSEHGVLGEVDSVFLSRHVESLMDLEGRKGLLLLKEPSGLLPGLFALVGLIDHVLVDGDLFVVEEGLELLVDEVDIVGGVLTGNVDVLEHTGLLCHPASSIPYRIILIYQGTVSICCPIFTGKRTGKAYCAT